MSSSAKYQFWALLFLCAVSLSVSFFVREKLNDGLLVGSESYKSLRIANEIKENGIISNDRLSYGNRLFFEEKLWYYLLSFRPDFLAKLLPMLFGILSFIIFYLLISKIKPGLKLVSSLILIFTPSFLYLFSASTKYSAAAFFILLGAYLFKINKRKSAFSSLLISGFFSILALIFTLLIFFFMALKKENYRDFSALFFGTLAIASIQFYDIFLLGLPEIITGFNNFTWPEFASFIIFGFGGKYGFGFFILFLALAGIYETYKEKYKFLIYYTGLFVFLLTSFYFNFILSYLTFILAFFAGTAILFFYNEEWKVGTFRFLVLLVIACSLMFSALVYYRNAGNLGPSATYFEAINYLENSKSDGYAFTDYRVSQLIAYSGHKVFLDNDVIYSPNIIKRQADYNFILNNTDLNDTLYLMKKYNIDYVVIDRVMEKEAFNNNDAGFLFLLRYSPDIFVNVFNNNEATIWKVNSTYLSII